MKLKNDEKQRGMVINNLCIVCLVAWTNQCIGKYIVIMVCNTYGLQIITIRLRARDFYEMITIIVIMSPSVTKILLNRIRSRASNLITLATEGRPSYKMDSDFRFCHVASLQKTRSP